MLLRRLYLRVFPPSLLPSPAELASSIDRLIMNVNKLLTQITVRFLPPIVYWVYTQCIACIHSAACAVA